MTFDFTRQFENLLQTVCVEVPRMRFQHVQEPRLDPTGPIPPAYPTHQEIEDADQVLVERDEFSFRQEI